MMVILDHLPAMETLGNMELREIKDLQDHR